MLAAICDGKREQREHVGRELAEKMKRREEPLKIVYFESGEDLAEQYEEGTKKYDLIFLSIHMKYSDGMKTARRIREYDRKVAIIFLADSPEYAVESYEVRACYYLLKPFSEEKFEDAVNKFMEERRPRRQPSLLMINGSGGRRIAYDDILYIESSRMVLRVVCNGNVEYTIRKKLGDVQRELTAPRFLRCNQSFIVNMDYVEAADANFIMKNGDKIPIKVREKKQIRQQYFDYAAQRDREG